MAAEMEPMFLTREKLWHGLGTKVEEVSSVKDALRLVGLDWRVMQEPRKIPRELYDKVMAALAKTKTAGAA